jgi:hypothetical protein
MSTPGYKHVIKMELVQDPNQPSSYLDPFTALPEAYVRKIESSWKIKSLITGLKELRPGSPTSQSTLKLTEKNLTQFFNPASYDDEMDLSGKEWILMREKRRVGVVSWIEGLP